MIVNKLIIASLYQTTTFQYSYIVSGNEIEQSVISTDKCLKQHLDYP